MRQLDLRRGETGEGGGGDGTAILGGKTWSVSDQGQRKLTLVYRVSDDREICYRKGETEADRHTSS